MYCIDNGLRLQFGYFSSSFDQNVDKSSVA